MRSGIMKGTFDEGLPSISMTGPKADLSTIVKLAASVALISPTAAKSSRPETSRAPQRLSEATQSAAVTAVPSLHLSPSRSLKVQVFLSAETFQLSTICGLMMPFAFCAKRVS